MKMTASALLCALLVLAPASGQPAKVYKWIDSRGNVVYSDSPRPGAEAIELGTEPAGIVPLRPEQMPQPRAPVPPPPTARSS